MNPINQQPLSRQSRTATKGVRLASCRKMLAQINKAKDTILAESRAAFALPDHLLRLALNEAEALAWQTRYPHLLFPTLAAEKVEGVAAWNAHQDWVRSNPVSAPAS